MKIKSRLFSGFIGGVIIPALALFTGMLIVNTRIRELERINVEVNNNYQVSIYTLTKLYDKYHELKKLVNLWIFSAVTDEQLFQQEFNEIYDEHVYPLTRELLLLSGEWDHEDSGLLNEIIFVLRERLHDEFLDIVKKAGEIKNSGSYTNDALTELMDESNILFVMSEVEQDFDYLTDKRKAWVESMVEKSGMKSSGIRKGIVLFTVFLLLILCVVSLHLYLYISNSALKIQKDISLLSSGIIPSPLPVNSNDVFGRIFVNLNKLHDYLHNLAKVMLKITEKDFSGGFIPASEHDIAGNAIMNLQENLKVAQEREENRKKEELERTWVAEGIARINDILRSSGDRIEELTYMLIREIVVYTDSKVGAVYILNNEDPENLYLEMSAVYAYDRKKHLKKELLVGEGLVGRCVQENETIYLTDVPDNYISIKSGLGETNPVSLLIVPLKLSDDSVHGAVEIASFSEQEPYRIRFIETIGENIATSISKMKINLRTRKLLEHTRQQTEEMTTQEEEMRQNMEELKAIQEQSALREEKLNKEIERLKALLDSK